MLKNNHRFDYVKFIKDIRKQVIATSFIIIVIILVNKDIINKSFMELFSINQENRIFKILFSIPHYEILGVDFLWIIFFICVLLFGISIYSFYKDYCNNNLLLIEHNSLNAMNFKIDKSELKNYSIKELKLNQYQIMGDEKLNLGDKIAAAIDNQINFLEQVKNLLSKGYDIGYVGIAHTPFIFLLGFMLGDENSIKIFHKYRDGIKDDKFYLLSYLGYSERFRKNCVHKEKFDTILLCIQTTFEILDDDIVHICEDNDYVLRYSTVNKEFDVINSTKQINDYVKSIKNDLHEICKLNNVKKIKICIASSVAFTFALAQSFSSNHDPEIEVFHFDTKDEQKYVWGINITKKKVLLAGVDY